VSAFPTALLPLKRYADFRGRSTRTELLYFYLLVTIAHVAIRFSAGLIGLRAADGVSILLSLALTCPGAALGVRRAHDVGFSGWWLSPMVPFVALGLWENFRRLGDPMVQRLDLPLAVQLPAALYSLGLIALLLWDDQVEINRYGPNPRHDAGEAIA